VTSALIRVSKFVVRVSKFIVLRVVLYTKISMLEARDQCLRVYGVKQDKGTRS